MAWLLIRLKAACKVLAGWSYLTRTYRGLKATGPLAQSLLSFSAWANRAIVTLPDAGADALKKELSQKSPRCRNNRNNR
jgi:hypothetical protein